MAHLGHNIYYGFETAAVARDAIRVDAPKHGHNGQKKVEVWIPTEKLTYISGMHDRCTTFPSQTLHL